MDIKRLDHNELAAYWKLIPADTPPFISPKAPPTLDTPNLLAIGAADNGRPIGLLLATMLSGATAEIQTLFVEEKSRHKGVGTSLLKAFDEELKNEQCLVVTMLYRDDIPDKTEFEELLKDCGYQSPSPLIYRYFFKAADFKPNWIFKNYRYPPTLQPFYWSEITKKEIREIQLRIVQGSVPQEVSPFLNGKDFEPINSFGLKKGDEIIGWSITERLNKSTIKYTSLYIEPEYHFSGSAVMLLIDSMLGQKKIVADNHPAIWAVFDLNLNQTESRWQHFIQRRLAPFSQKTIIMNLTWKNITI